MTFPADPGDLALSSVADETAGVRRAAHSARIMLGRAFVAESADYGVLLGLTLFIVVFGLLMVLSSSYVDAHSTGSGDLSKFATQAAYALVGIPLMLFVSRLPVRFWQRISLIALIGSCALQCLVVFTPLGEKINNNTNWLHLGPIVFQPSELIKMALVVWLGTFFTRKKDKLRSFRETLLPALIVTVVPLALVVKGGDLGTTMVLGLMLLGVLFFVGVPLWQLGVVGVGAALAALTLAFSSRNRTDRILAFLHPTAADPNGTGYQILQAHWGMADGGVLGVGLGNSESKWNWLPASSTDFIYAITAEELGMIGAILVLVLFCALAVVLLRVIRTSPSVFVRAATGGIFAWIIGEAVINIAVVLGLFPVLGVPLPLFSSGGTSLISTLVALGIVLGFARKQERRDDGMVTAAAAPRRRTA
ncbi:MAG: putative lipid II flippase FtsW [Microbacteriaceae bacterium]|nr:putative lipid II flippase FtsW [Microbacteriaceae bacterium]